MAAVAASSLIPVSPAFASPSSPKVPLVLNSLNNCERGAGAIPGSGTSTDSYVRVKPLAGVGVRTEVHVRNASPHTAYRVYVIQVSSTPDGVGNALDCYTVDGTVNTNAAGMASISLSEAVRPGADRVHVYLWATTGTFHTFDTNLIAL